MTKKKTTTKTKTKAKPAKYRYAGSCLPNVFLRSGFEVVDSPYGRGMSVMDIKGLHDLLGDMLLTKDGRLTRLEFKFLRLELEFSQETLAQLIGCTEQSVMRWETGKSKIDPAAERVLRGLYGEHRNPKSKFSAVIARMRAMDAVPVDSEFVASQVRGTWHVKAA